MKSLTILILLLVFQSCNTSEYPSEIKRIYSLNKTKSFSEFKNWNIYLREQKDNIYLFDYIQDNKMKSRYLVVDDDSILFKRIFPVQDSVFFSLNTDSLNKNLENFKISIELYQNFKSLAIDAIFYRPMENLFLIKENNFTLVRTLEPKSSLPDNVQYKGYKKIDPYWYYFKDER